jgi:LCP family protein required for cell wall assembly
MGDDSTPLASRKVRRSWPQRLTILIAVLAALACFVAAAALYAGQRIVEDRNLVSIVNPADTAGDADARFEAAAVEDEPELETGVVTEEAEGDATGEGDPPVETFPQAEPAAQNFLITGADNNSCIDESSPYAPAFGDRTAIGERSDTVMMFRVNPDTSQVAVLSFPRDLWVTIPGRSGQQRINVAYERDAPQRLIDTIYQNFGVPTDHFIQVDFCAFKTLVDALDGVAVPFTNPVRDENTGLNVTETGCYTFDGDHALAYVRSRKLEALVDGEWVRDPTSDLGRISRQQDFIRRMADELLSSGRFSPDVIGGIVETNSEYVVTDSGLTTRKILEFAGVLQNVDPAQITTYQIEATPATIQGNSVLVPSLTGENMSKVLSVFQGTATLASAPDPDASTTTTTAKAANDNGSDNTTGGNDADEPANATPTTAPAPATTLPEVEAEEIVYGFVPDPTVSC